MDGEVLAERKPSASAREKTLAVTFIKFIVVFGLRSSGLGLKTDVLGTRQEIKCD